jgi:hypothetical protein
MRKYVHNLIFKKEVKDNFARHGFRKTCAKYSLV